MDLNRALQGRDLRPLLVTVLLMLLLSVGIRSGQQALFLNLAQNAYLKAHAGDGSYAAAQAYLDHVLPTSPADAQLLLAQSRLYLAEDSPEAVLRLALPGADHNPLSGLWQGHALLEAGQIDEALEVWRQAGVSSEYLVGLANQNGDIAWLKLADRLDTTSHTAFLLGQAYEKLGLAAESMAMYRQANAIDDGWLDERERFRGRYLLALLMYSQRGQEVSRFDAQTALLEAITAARAVDPQTLSGLLLRLGAVARESGDYSLAEESLGELVDRSPSAENFLLLAEATFLASHSADGALPHFARAIELSAFGPDTVRRIRDFALRNEEIQHSSWLADLSDGLSKPVDFGIDP